jgi:hypothetical protein
MADDLAYTHDAPQEALLRQVVGSQLPKTITWNAWPAVVIRIYFETLDDLQEQFSCSRSEAVYLLHKVSTLGMVGRL